MVEFQQNVSLLRSQFDTTMTAYQRAIYGHSGGLLIFLRTRSLSCGRKLIGNEVSAIAQKDLLLDLILQENLQK
jgi:hypothetical protein